MVRTPGLRGLLGHSPPQEPERALVLQAVVLTLSHGRELGVTRLESGVNPEHHEM